MESKNPMLDMNSPLLALSAEQMQKEAANTDATLTLPAHQNPTTEHVSQRLMLRKKQKKVFQWKLFRTHARKAAQGVAMPRKTIEWHLEYANTLIPREAYDYINRELGRWQESRQAEHDKIAKAQAQAQESSHD